MPSRLRSNSIEISLFSVDAFFVGLFVLSSPLSSALGFEGALTEARRADDRVTLVFVDMFDKIKIKFYTNYIK